MVSTADGLFYFVRGILKTAAEGLTDELDRRQADQEDEHEDNRVFHGRRSVFVFYEVPDSFHSRHKRAQ